ncbi:lysozyme [Burkholderia sp. DN3021]|uniref:lysozyme n=1 Tax=Burkholderia sp. DN3021 TaxID=3410137 RepID=UPI003C7A2760
MAWQTEACKLIKQFEGCKLKAYPDPATGAAPWTVGYGATGPLIGPATVWTQVQADQDLLDRVTALGAFIDSEVKIPLTDEEKAALISFTYNVGRGNFDHSTLRTKLNAGDIEGASQEFLKWDMAAGHVMQGLLNRRNAEMAEFLLGADFTVGSPSLLGQAQATTGEAA